MRRVGTPSHGGEEGRQGNDRAHQEGLRQAQQEFVGEDLYLEIPEEDFGLTLTIKRSTKKPEKLTIAKLFNLEQPWRKFSDATVTATGPFSMSANQA
jgi:hypothetical protein